MNHARTIQHPFSVERRWLYGAMSLLVCSVVLYIYFISASVHHVVMRKEVDNEIMELQSTLSALETTFIEAQHAVSADIASMHGFTRTSDKIFIDAKEPSLVLRTN